jgi:uncharacterized membrane protein YqjE
MEDKHPQAVDTNPGLIAGVIGMAKNGFGLLVSRIELAALELSEVRGNLIRLLLVLALGIVAGWFAIACWTVLIVVLSWDALGWKILLILAAAFTLLTAGMLLHARSILRQGKLSMPATLAELRNDRDALLQPEQTQPAE